MMKRELNRLRIGYAPISGKLDAPGDRRRFVHYARMRGVQFEMADPRRDYDLVILSQAADITAWSRYRKGKIVYDLVDAYLAVPRTDPRALLRGLGKYLSRQSRFLEFDFRKSIEAMCRRADAVLCSTVEQQGDIANYCENVRVILDMQSATTTKVKREYKAASPPRLVWEGLPFTLAAFEQIAGALRRVQRKTQFEMHIVTDLHYYRYLNRYAKTSTARLANRLFDSAHLHAWNESSCAEIICASDLALIPLNLNDPFARRKPENKLLLFWRLGMPTLTSATPAYRRAMQGAQLSMDCATEGEWEVALEKYLTDESARREAGQRGRAYAEQKYPEDKLLAAWDDVLESVLI